MVAQFAEAKYAGFAPMCKRLASIDGQLDSDVRTPAWQMPSLKVLLATRRTSRQRNKAAV
jgi:hypothetical protein